MQFADTGALEAVLFAAGKPVSVADLSHILEREPIDVKNLLTRLQQELDARGSGITLRWGEGGCQLMTRQELYPIVERLSQVVDRRLSAPTMETLSIIAFKQPITKQEIEHVRGVRIERALAKLLELELVAEVGRKHVLGRPILYGTTETFLRCFGISSLDELPALPSMEEVSAGLDAEQLELLSAASDGESDAAERVIAGEADETDESLTGDKEP